MSSQNELEEIHLHSHQASKEYFKRCLNFQEVGKTDLQQLLSKSVPNVPKKLQDKGSSLNHEDGQLCDQMLSMENLSVCRALVSSPSFHRARMKAGIVDVRSSFNVRIGTNSRRQLRAFPGTCVNHSRTQGYAGDNDVSKNVCRRDPPVPPVKPKLSSLSHNPHTFVHTEALIMSNDVRQKPCVEKCSKENYGGLCRSHSNLDIENGHGIEDSSNAGAMVSRKYGSTSSLDILACAYKKHPDTDIMVDHVDDSRLRQSLVQPLNDVDWTVVGVDVGCADHGISDIRLKDRDRKNKVKSNTYVSDVNINTNIFKKLRVVSGKHDYGNNSKSGEKYNGHAMTVDRIRNKAFAYFDCQSIGISFAPFSHAQATARFTRNITTGASAASSKRNSCTLSGDRETIDVVEEVDFGDGKSNELLQSCQFFRNEIGGDCEQILTTSRLAAYTQIVSASGDFNCNLGTVCIPLMRRHAACCGVAILDSSSSSTGLVMPPLVAYRGHVIEYVDHGAYYYRHFFYGQDHQNFFGLDEHVGPVAVSVKREKLDPNKRANNLGKADYGTYHFRIICRTTELATLRGSILEDVISSTFRQNNSRGVPLKDVLEMTLGSDIQLSCLKQATPGPKTAQQLMKLDELGICTTYKVGIMYCRAGQSTEEEMYNNQCGSSIFEEFLNLIGDKVRLKGFDKYRGGLDCKTDTTGLYSYYTTFNNYQVMFHVSTVLPFTPNNRQQLLRKRHIGNNIVTIVFQEPGSMAFSPRSVLSQFQHVFIIVKASNPNEDDTHYSVAVSRSKDVASFGPPMPDSGCFFKDAEFVDFLLAKIINAENAVHKSEKFLTMAQRTRREYLKDLAANFSTNNSIDSGSKFSRFALGSGRRREKGKQRVVLDMLTLGALVWNVQLEDVGTLFRMDCFMAVGPETVVLLDAPTKDVIFAVPCSAVLGWSIQASSICLYFGRGECILLRPLNGDMDELTEIVTRLTAVSQGTEAVKLVLKRNGLGQLGFHIQSEGIVTDVESYGFAWEVGLRKGSRLVEICKVATVTLSHDQIVDLLRTSAVVMVIVVPPLDDGTPRGDSNASLVPCCSTVNMPTSSPIHPTINCSSVAASLQSAAQAATNSIVYHSAKNSLCIGTHRSSCRSAHSHNCSTGSTVVSSKNSSMHCYSNPTFSALNCDTSHETPADMTLCPVSADNDGANATRSGCYSDSTLSSGRGSDDGRASSAHSHSRQESDIVCSFHDSHFYSGDGVHSRSGSQDSTDHSVSSGSKQGLFSLAHRQFRTAIASKNSSSCLNLSTSCALAINNMNSIYTTVSHHSNCPAGQRRQFTNVEYASSSLSVSGSIAFELLKQTQNTKYLLEQEMPPVANCNAVTRPCASVSLTVVSCISGTVASASRDFQHLPSSRDHENLSPLKDLPLARKISVWTPTKKQHVDKSPMSSSHSSPRSSKSVVISPSDEALIAGRLTSRSGVTAIFSRANLQEKLKRLIDPDMSASDFSSSAVLCSTSDTENQVLPTGLRGVSDIERCPTTGLQSDRGIPVTISLADVNSKASLATGRIDKAVSCVRSLTRESPDMSPCLAVSLQDTVLQCSDTTNMDWCNLVHVATKAMGCGERLPPFPTTNSVRHVVVETPPPPPRPPFPNDSALSIMNGGDRSAAWISLSMTPEQRVAELEGLVRQLQLDLDKEKQRSGSQESEMQTLRTDNIRLQDELETAGTQLRRFTEWFFNAIDRQ